MKKPRPGPKGSGDTKNPAASQRAASFDPWTATVEESLALPLDLDDPRSLLWQYAAAQGLLDRRAEIQRGDSAELLAAVATCAQRGLVIPDWLERPFVKGVRAVTGLRADSWDIAFGRPHPGRHVAQLRAREAARRMVCHLVREFVTRSPTSPIGDYWEEIAARAKITRKQAEKLHAEAIKSDPRNDPRAMRERLGFAPNPQIQPPKRRVTRAR